MGIEGTARYEIAVSADSKKSERFKQVLTVLENSSPASTAEDAHSLVKEAFDLVESAYQNIGGKETLMGVTPFFLMEKIKFNSHNVYYSDHAVHVLFIAENGAIEIRKIPENARISKLITDNTVYPQESMLLVFAKSGANGIGVWN